MTSRLRFDHFTEMIAERIEDPSSSSLERYVGLEHLDPEAIDIKRWGVPADVTSTKFRFYPGDVIYGRRRAYQRKAGLADFDGLASAHALVLRAVVGVCDPAYLAYMLVSESFTRVAVGISVGSLSPTINWRDLRIQEFDLPSLDEQRRVVEVMRAADRAIEAAQAVASATSLTMSTLDLSSFQRRSLLEVSTVVRGLRLSPERRMTAWPTYRTVRAGNISWAGIDFDDFREMKASPVELKSFVLKGGDILMVEGGGPDSVGVSAIFPEDGPPNLLPQDSLLLIQARQGVSAQYLYWALRNVMLSGELARIASGSTITHLTKEAFVKISIPVPDLPTQDQIVHSFSRLQSLQLSANEAEQRGQVLRTSLLQELIG